MMKNLTVVALALFLVGCTTTSGTNPRFVSPNTKHEVIIDNSSILLVAGVKAIGLVKNRKSKDSYNEHIVSVDSKAKVKIHWLSNEEILIRCDELTDEKEKTVEGILIRFE